MRWPNHKNFEGRVRVSDTSRKQSEREDKEEERARNGEMQNQVMVICLILISRTYSVDFWSVTNCMLSEPQMAQ